jgi:NAD(P) transhydrogenase
VSGALQKFDFVVIGSGPAGQKAAIQAAKSGQRVAVVEREATVGGACVHSGTIPSKSLREQALRYRAAHRRSRGTAELLDVPLSELLAGVAETVAAHDRYMAAQLERNQITLLRGRAHFRAPGLLSLRLPDGRTLDVMGDRVVIATGSRPRAPDNITVDHEHVLDSDSILSLPYLPRSLLVAGSGVIASEYASMLAALGCHVVQVDRSARPLAFLDAELTDCYLQELRNNGGDYLGGVELVGAAFDGVCRIECRLSNGETLHVDKVLVASGRLANVDTLNLAAAGVELAARGHIAVDDEFATNVPGIYAAGDVIGPPALASVSMEQGRRAACHALGLMVNQELGSGPPSGIYTIPEMATVGSDEATVRRHLGGAMVGRARFAEIARGQIAGAQTGLLKLVADPDGRRVLGAQVVGDGAADLVHIAQMGIAAHFDIDAFIDNVFNFPTLAEAYRVAALDIARQRRTATGPLALAAAVAELL